MDAKSRGSTYAAFILLCWASAVTKIRFHKAFYTITRYDNDVPHV